jgi:thiol:disulfide interchange protein DsbA
MKRLSSIAVLVSFALLGCGGGEQPAADEPAAAMPEQAPMGAETEAPAPAAAPADPAAQPAMVEESAAEEETKPADQTILLAQADAADADRDWKYSEGQHYARMVPTQPTVGGADKVEVAEIFWYGCNHCYDFEPFVNRWKETMSPNARFVRIPAVWNPLVKLHAQLYYTEEVLASNGKLADPDTFRAAVFAEYHRRGNRLASVESIQTIFEKHGVSAEDFESTWNSFEVAQKIRVAEDLTRRYAITGVPTVVVNGKYRTGAGEAGGYPQLLELIDELIVKESMQ